MHTSTATLPPRILLATSNPGKLREFSSLLAPLGVELVPQESLNIPATEEPYPSFVENALAKARHAARASGLPALADDSGLCVEALDGAPGVRSARFAGENASDEDNNAQLLEAILACPADASRRAFYCCVLAFVRDADDPCPVISEGRWHGEITTIVRGSNGFGYDPLFYLPELQQTAAELDPAIKNVLSHRSLALTDMVQRLLRTLPVI